MGVETNKEVDMEWLYVGAMLISAILGVLATLFGDKYSEVKKLSKLKSEILEDKEITQEQMEKIIEKIRKIFGRD